MFKILLTTFIIIFVQTAEAQEYLAPPQEIELSGNLRRESFSTTIGNVELRWQRQVERILSKTPQRSVIEAMRASSRVVRKASFPTDLQSLNLEWNIIFLDENLPESQIPSHLRNNCHPGWMTPPANIYIVAQRVVKGCSGNNIRMQDSDKEIFRILSHEIGHVIEYQILSNSRRTLFNNSRLQSEGFASWFEIQTAGESSIINQREVINQKKNLAKIRLQQRGNSVSTFYGDSLDYALSAIYFYYLESRFGIRSIFDIYRYISNDSLDFFSAIAKRTSLNKNALEEEISKFLQ